MGWSDPPLTSEVVGSSQRLIVVHARWIYTPDASRYAMAVHSRLAPMTASFLPGRTLDGRASDPVLIEKTPTLTTRLGPEELQLLHALADEFETTRSNLARRLVVKGLIELRDGLV